MNDISSSLSKLLGRQNKRLLKLSFPNNDGPEALLLINQMSALEALSRDFRINLQLLCDDAFLELKDLMGRMVTVELERANGTVRYFNGYVFKFGLERTDAGYSYYEMELRPWTRFLDQGSDCRLFQTMTLEDALKSIFGRYGTLPKFSFKLQKHTGPETFRCQWDESDYNYLHRRIEEKGWYYRYEHHKDGHTLVISDDSTLAQPIDGVSQVRFHGARSVEQEDSITGWSPLRSLETTQVSSSSFDFKNPRPIQAEMSTINRQGSVCASEAYEYAGAYGFATQNDGRDLVKRRMEEIEARAKRFKGKGNCRLLQAGRTFELTQHFDHDQGEAEDRQFLVVEVHHVASNNYLEQNGETVYKNDFTALRKHIPYRPGLGRNSETPKLYGMQTAVVVGPAGEDIFTDKYGRIRVQFHWDRLGKNNETSSCWIRVASTWAGSNFGAIALPRIGQEVIVQWLDGCVDHPMVTGSVYNAHNMPPWSLPDNKTQSGILTRSTVSGSPANANALRFEDKKGQEEVWLHAEKDQRIEVEHDESHTVGHDRTKTVDHDETVHIKHDRTETVDNNETITVHNNRTERVDSNETISIGGNRSEDVGGNESITIDGMKSETVKLAKAENIGLAKALSIGAAYQITVGAAMNTSVGLMQAEEIGQSKSVIVGSSYTVKVVQDMSKTIGTTYKLSAGDKLEFDVGSSHFTMTSDGHISLKGTSISIEASGAVTINGKDVDINP